MKVFCFNLNHKIRVMNSKSYLVCVISLFFAFYSCEAKTNHTSPEITLVASTPGGEAIKSLLGIPYETKVDFIR
jgi:hypothetical protein